MMPINLSEYIERAIDKKHLIVTVPCIVEFLSMMDEHAFLIDSIQDAVSILIMIYNSECMFIKNEKFSIDKLLVLLSIAWLLQLKNIPNNQLKISDTITLNDDKSGLVIYSFQTK
jgi:hypothetical protein